MLRQYINKGILLLLCLSLLACQGMPKSPGNYNVSPVTTGVVAGGVTGAAVGAAVGGGVGAAAGATLGGMVGGSIGMGVVPDYSRYTREQMLMLRLQDAHIQIIAVGQDVMLVLPTPIFFYTDSSHFNDGMLPTLSDIADFINLFDVETVKVSGYTNVLGSQTRNLALSRAQAQFIAHELWDRGLQSTMIYAVGYGSANPIADNQYRYGLLTNNRIQITFRRLTPET